MQVTTKGPLTLRYGWDAPLQYFALTVEDGNRLVYSNMDDPEARSGTYGGGLSLPQLCAKLAAFGVQLSETEVDSLKRNTPPASKRPAVLTHLLDSLARSHMPSDARGEVPMYELRCSDPRYPGGFPHKPGDQLDVLKAECDRLNIEAEREDGFEQWWITQAGVIIYPPQFVADGQPRTVN